MKNDIYRKRVCSMCGSIEWKPYIGSNTLDGGFSENHMFEPSEYIQVSVGMDTWTVCPKCAKMIRNDIQKLPEAIKRGRQE